MALIIIFLIFSAIENNKSITDFSTTFLFYNETKLNNDQTLNKEDEFDMMIKSINDYHSLHKEEQSYYLFVDQLYDKHTELIDTYKLFLYYKTKYNDSFYVILKSNPLFKKITDENDGEIPRNLIPVDFSYCKTQTKLLKYLFPYLIKTKLIVYSFADFFPLLVNKISNIKFFYLDHGVIYFKESILKWGYITQKSIQKIAVKSPYEKEILKKYGFKDSQFIYCGLPRWTRLTPVPNFRHRSQCILSMFTWRGYKNRNFDGSLYKSNMRKLLLNRKLSKTLKEYNITLYVVAHHLEIKSGNYNYYQGLESSDFIEVIETNMISRYVKKCGLLVTDYSSLSFDFMFQNKPVIYFLLDQGDKMLTSSQRQKLIAEDLILLPNKTLNFLANGNLVYNVKDAVKKIVYYVKNEFRVEKEIKFVYDSVFYFKEKILENLREEINNYINE